MTRTKLADRKLPDYTRGEELFHMISHIVGGAIAIVALVLCVVKAALKGNGYGVVSCSIYGFTMILLYTMSSVYHGLKNEAAKKVMQVLDHCSIYLLIAGTYTPIALSALRKVHPALGWTVFGVEWGLALLAITFTAIDLKKYRVFSMVCYIGMGWGIVALLGQAARALTMNGCVILLAGGIFYTVGAIVYGIGKKKRYMHGLFHIFVLLGSVAHFAVIFLYAI